MTVLGFWLTVLALGACLAAFTRYYRAASGTPALIPRARLWTKVSVASVIVASVLLTIMLLRHDFTNGYVYSYSSKSLPLHFLLSSFYAGQEGSFLFWTLCSSLIALALIRTTSSQRSEPQVMTAYLGVQAMLLLLLIAKSPFKYVWDMFPGAPVNQMPVDGSGLNPLLQNFWMTIHPPVLFVGFAAMAVPFSFAVAGLWKKQIQLLSDQGFSWLLFTVLSLGAGLMLGAYWAYGVLGWGGYWGWDPVENSSLVPWLTSSALLHTLIAQRRTMRFVRTNYALAIVSFFLVVYSTFLTRSGILGDSSVHSFSDPGATVYWLLIAFLGAILGTGFGLMYARRRILVNREPADTGFFSRESLLGAGTIALVLSAVVTLFGTSLPIFSNTTVEPSFYDAMNLPIAILMALLIGYSLYAQWGNGDTNGLVVRSLKALGSALVVSAVLFYFGMRDILILLFAFSSLFALFVNIDLVVKTITGDWRMLGGKFAHIGLAVFFLGVIASGKYSTTDHVSLPLHSPVPASGHSMMYTGYSPTDDGKFAFNIRVEKDGESFQIAPIMFDAGKQGIMRNPDIASFLTTDFYVAPVSLEQPQAHADHSHETYTIRKGETVKMGEVQAKFVKFDMSAHGEDAMAQGMAVGSVLELSHGAANETIIPRAIYRADGTPTYQPSQSKLMGANVQLVSMDVGMGTGTSAVTLEVVRGDDHSHATETLVVEVSIKPFINLVWGGTVLLMAGLVLSIFKRVKEGTK